jgi:hypothetical protein
MGGPYIPLEMAVKLIERLLAREPFFGKIVLECEGSQIYRLSEDRTRKRVDVERWLVLDEKNINQTS